jgi:signal transduction histidine kinase
MPAAELPHIFEKFYRGAEAKRSVGTGLGLSIVQTIAELSGGRVSVRSGANGNEFDLELPSAGRGP